MLKKAMQERQNDTPALIELAAKGLLPEFQYMDRPTWRWILRNNPGYRLDPADTIAPALAWLCALTPPQDWFLDRRVCDSLHGLRHLKRTAYYSLLLASQAGLELEQAKLAAVAALLHDIRRRQDKADAGHAVRAATWCRANATKIAQYWHIDISELELNSITAALALHETPYADFTPAQQTLYKTHQAYVDILKTADALDRYRLPKLSWWINDSRLEITPSVSLKQCAYEIVLASEGYFLQKDDSLASVAQAIEDHERAEVRLSHTWIGTHISYAGAA